MLQWIFIFYLSLESETVYIRLSRKFHFSLLVPCIYILHIFRSISTLKENFFLFLFFILERIFTEQIINFNEECRENYRLQDHVFTTRNVSIGFCNLLSIIAFVFHYFPLFSTRGQNFSSPSLYLLLFFPRFFQSSESIKRNILIRVQRDSMLTRFLIVFLYSFVFLSFFFFFSKALSTIKGREELAHHRSLFSFPFKRRISKRSIHRFESICPFLF